jgi:hypothetical protein
MGPRQREQRDGMAFGESEHESSAVSRTCAGNDSYGFVSRTFRYVNQASAG